MVTRDSGEDEEVNATSLNINRAGDLEFCLTPFCETPRTYLYIAARTWRDCSEVSE